MMMTALAVAALTALTAVPVPRHDAADLLYSTQIFFDPHGVPVVTVGLMTGQSEITVRAAAGLEVRLSGAGDARITLPPGHELIAHLIDAIPGQTRYRVVLEDLRGGDLAGFEDAKRRWGARGIAVSRVEIGGVVGFPGRLLDNRRLMVVDKHIFPTRKAANARATQLTERFMLGKPLSSFAQPVRRPQGVIVASDPQSGVVVRQRDLLTVRAANGGPVEVARVEYGKGYKHHGFADRLYHGAIIIAVDPTAHLAAVNRVSAEYLLRGLVPSETFPSAPAAALDAQAISARGELLAKLGVRHLADPYLVCATQHCQVYSGIAKEEPSTNAAVARTRGLVLFNGKNRVVDSVYSASCGGHTESNENVWEGLPDAALRGVVDAPDRRGIPWGKGKHPTERQVRRFILHPPKDSYCREASKGRGVFRWIRRYPDAVLDGLVNARHPIGHIEAIDALGRGVSGRVIRVRFVGTHGSVVVPSELAVRRLLGNLRSGLFVTDHVDGVWIFHGGGYGHGVGMCQYGAIGMAEAGKTAKEILRHYFTGSHVEKVY